MQTLAAIYTAETKCFKEQHLSYSKHLCHNIHLSQSKNILCCQFPIFLVGEHHLNEMIDLWNNDLSMSDPCAVHWSAYDSRLHRRHLSLHYLQHCWFQEHKFRHASHCACSSNQEVAHSHYAACSQQQAPLNSHSSASRLCYVKVTGLQSLKLVAIISNLSKHKLLTILQKSNTVNSVLIRQ